MDGRLQVFAGNSHPRLAAAIMQELESPLGRAIVGEYENGETKIKLDENVRGSDVFVIQSICTPYDHHLMELLLLDRCASTRIGRPDHGRHSLLRLLQAGEENDRTRTDLGQAGRQSDHGRRREPCAQRRPPCSRRSKGSSTFPSITSGQRRCSPVIAAGWRWMGRWSSARMPAGWHGPRSSGPDRVDRSASSRSTNQTPDGVGLEMVGDVSGKVAIVVDDMISTGTTLEQAVTLLNERGAAEIHVAATHAIFAADAVARISLLPIKNIYVYRHGPAPDCSQSPRA